MRRIKLFVISIIILAFSPVINLYKAIKNSSTRETFVNKDVLEKLDNMNEDDRIRTLKDLYGIK